MGDPVQAPPTFSDFRFNSIGHISLLARLSDVSAQAQPLQTDEEDGDEDDLYIDMDVDTPEPPNKQPVLLARIGDRPSTLGDADSRNVDSHKPLVHVFPQLPPGKTPVPNEISGGQPVTREESETTNALNATSCDAAGEHTSSTLLQGAPLLSISPILANAQKQQSAKDHPGQLQASTGHLPTPPPTSFFVPQEVGTPAYTLHHSSTPPLCNYPSLEQLLQEERTIWSEAAEMKHSRAGLGISNIPTASEEPASETRSQSVHADVHPKLSTPTFMNQDNGNHMHSETMPINSNSASSPNTPMPRENQHGHPSLLSKPAEGDGRFGHRMHSSSSPSQTLGFAEVVDDSPQPISATVDTALPKAEGILQTSRKSGRYAINEIALNTPQPSGQTPVQSAIAPENRSPREEQLKSLLMARRSGHSLDPAEMPQRSASQLQNGSEPHTLSPQPPSNGIPLRSECNQCLDLGTTLAKSHLPRTDSPQRACRSDNDSSAPHAQLLINDASERSISHIVRSSAIKRKASHPPPPLSGVSSNQATNQVTKRQKTTDRAPQDNTLKTTRVTSNLTSDLNSPSCKLSGVTSLPPDPISVACNSTGATAQPPSDTTNNAPVVSVPPKQVARAKSTPSPSIGSKEVTTPCNYIPPIKTEGDTNGPSGLDPRPLVRVKKEEPEEIMIRVKVEEDMKALEAELQKPLPIHANTIPLKKEESSDGTPFQPRNPSSSEFQERSQSVPAARMQPESPNSQQQQSVEQNDQTNRQREDTLVSKMVSRDCQTAALHHRPIPSEVSDTRTLLPGQQGFAESCGRNSEPRLISPAPSTGAHASTSRSHSREEITRQPRNSDRQIRPGGMTGETTGRLAGRSTRQRERSRELNPRLLDHWSPPRDCAPLRMRPIADTYRPPPSPPEHARRIPRRTMNVHRRDRDEDNLAQRRGDTWLAGGYTPHISRRSRSASPRRSYRNRTHRSPSPPPRQAIYSKIGSPVSHQDRRAAMRTPSPRLHSLRDERAGLSRSFDTQSTTNHPPGPSWTLVDGFPFSIATHDEQPAPLHHANNDVANTRCKGREPALDTGAQNTSYVERDLIPNDSNLCPVDHGHPSCDERTQSHDYRLVPVPALGPTDETTDLLHDKQNVSQGAATVHNERPTTAPPGPDLDLGRTIIAATENNASVFPHESLSSLSSANLASSQLPWPSHAPEQSCGTFRGLTTSGASIEPIANHREEERIIGAKISSCRRENVVNDVQTALDEKDTEQSGAEGRMKENQTLGNAQQLHGLEIPMRPNADSMRKTPEMSDPPSVVSGHSPNLLPLLPSRKRHNTSRPLQRGQPHPQPGEDPSQPSNENTIETSSQSLVQRISDEPAKPAPMHYDSDSAISLDTSPPRSPIPTLSSRLGGLLIHDESSHLKNHIPTIASSDASLSSRITEPKPKAHQVRHALPPKPVPRREPINADSKAGSKLNNDPPKPSHASSTPQLLKRLNVGESEREPERPFKSRRGGRGATSVGRGRVRVHVGDHYSPRSPPRKTPTRSKPSLEDRLS